MVKNMKTGVLLINLGTPDNTKISSIRRYLREFLLDPRVIDLNGFLRRLLVYGAILPFRAPKTAEAYQKIWSASGSPLLLHTQTLATKVQAYLGDDYNVMVGMRYGAPSIATSLKTLKQCQTIVAIPLFPQYSSAATGSAIAKLLTEVEKNWNIPKLAIIDNFFTHKSFISAYAELIKPFLNDSDAFLLLSYHGLPERHVKRSGCDMQCDQKNPCPLISSKNYFCYRAQCYETSKLLMKNLGLSHEQCMTSFQSRLGRTPWIKPYTDEVLPQLREKGIKNLVIACPSFVSDCLETLEEIGMQAREQWHALGGEKFSLVPCLNASDTWVKGIANMVQKETTHEA